MDRDVGSSSLLAEDLEEEEDDLIIAPTELGSESDAFIKDHPWSSSSTSRQGTDHDQDETETGHRPTDNDDVIDPRLKNYPIPLVAKTVDLHNDET